MKWALLAVVLAAVPAWSQPIQLVRVNVGAANAYNAPVLVTQPAGESARLFVVEQAGVIRIMDAATGARAATPFLTVPSVRFGGEGGLLGMAFHPGYASNGYFYIYYNRAPSATAAEARVIARYRVSGDPNVADPASAAIILAYGVTTGNHNGGWTAFGPDGRLFVAWGDRGNSSNAPDITDNLLGKILRLDVNGPDGVPGTMDDDQLPDNPDRNYAIPPDNPFVGVTGDDEIWAYGVRNPWRNSFDRLTGELYIADVGSGRLEEVSVAPAPPLAGGRNYGWPCMEGNVCYPSGEPACACNVPELIEPAHVYPGGGTAECAVSGGYVYRGCAMPWLRGLYFFGDYCSGKVWTARYDGAALVDVTDRTAELWGAVNTSILSFGEDRRGELYICGSNGGIYRMVGTTVPNQCGCGTADFNGDEDFGTDADIESFFLCLGGSCCASCFEGGSDFNGDGDAGTDGDIEAFFRVLAGGFC